MVRDLIRRDEADTEATDVLALPELASARQVHDPVVVAAVALALLKWAHVGVEVAAVVERAAVPDPQAFVHNVERDFLSWGVVSVLNQLERHDVVALQCSTTCRPTVMWA